MTDGVKIALLSLSGSILGSVAGIISSAKLIFFRLEKIEKKLDEINKINFKIPILENEQQHISMRLSTLEQRVEGHVLPA